MNKSKIHFPATFLLLSAFLLPLTSCGGEEENSQKAGEGLSYPTTGYADANSDSWLQIGEDPTITINWFVNMSAWGTAATVGTKVEAEIYAKTGIRVNFITPITDDGAQLSTMISSGKLPDVITLGSGTEQRVQLAEGGYAYPIQELAKRYAPTLLSRIDPDIANYYAQSDGNIYGLPNHFYTQSDLKAYQEQEGKNLLPNGAMLARKDYLDAYIAANPAAVVTTPEGIKAMCQWVKQTYSLSNANPTFCLDHFSSSGSTGINWLSEYFMVPPEDANGNLTLSYQQSENKELFLWLNDLYRSRLISSSNFTSSLDSIGGYLANGLPFLFVGSPQLYSVYFKQAYAKNIDYVPIVMTNSKGTAPQLRSLAGNGWLFPMITSKCKRPERVIKLFDYLMSNEGQAHFYGLMDEDWAYDKKPGESGIKTIHGQEKNVTYKYGQIHYLEKAWNDIQNGDTSKYGFGYSNILVNPMYPRLSSETGEVLNNYMDYLDYNRKAALIDFACYKGAFEFVRDATAENYIDVVNSSNNITNLWTQYTPKIISAASSQEAESMYDTSVNNSLSMGAKDVLASDNAAFQKNKKALNITYAWAPNDPKSDYHSLKVTSIYGNRSYVLAIPDNIVRN